MHKDKKKIIVMLKLRFWELRGSNTLKASPILGRAKVKKLHPLLHSDLYEFALKKKQQKRQNMQLEGEKKNRQILMEQKRIPRRRRLMFSEPRRHECSSQRWRPRPESDECINFGNAE